MLLDKILHKNLFIYFVSKRKIIIVGGSGSIGSAIAKEVINDGFDVTIIGRNYFALEKISKSINCSFMIADVANTEELKNSLNLCGENIYGLVYCAGSINMKSLSTAHENEYIDSFKVNTLGAITSIKST